jgi:AbrB family looped-hinge helix DNA binding protein
MIKFTRKMSKKGEIIIPKYFRDKYNIIPGDIVILSNYPGYILIGKKE